MIQEDDTIYGLTEKEAKRRNDTFGYNELEEKKKISAIGLFFSQFNDFITWVLIAATIISGIMGQKADAITILIIVIPIKINFCFLSSPLKKLIIKNTPHLY